MPAFDAVCRWCGDQYHQHFDYRPPNAPVPRVPCIKLKRNFKAREAQVVAAAPEPIRPCGCDEAKAWQARALAAESEVKRIRQLARGVDAVISGALATQREIQKETG